MPKLSDPKAKEHLNHFINEHAPTINLHVKKLKAEGRIPEDHDIDDLHMAGIHGLMHAVKHYNPALGIKFTTYANHIIRGHMLANLSAKKDVPRTLVDQARRLKEMEKVPQPKTEVPTDKPASEPEKK